MQCLALPNSAGAGVHLFSASSLPSPCWWRMVNYRSGVWPDLSTATQGTDQRRKKITFGVLKHPARGQDACISNFPSNRENMYDAGINGKQMLCGKYFSTLSLWGQQKGSRRDCLWRQSWTDGKKKENRTGLQALRDAETKFISDSSVFWRPIGRVLMATLIDLKT